MFIVPTMLPWVFNSYEQKHPVVQPRSQYVDLIEILRLQYLVTA